jgi:hypothetical protein
VVTGRADATEDRGRESVREVDVEALDLAGATVQLGEVAGVLVDPDDRMAAAQDRLHRRTGGHPPRRGQR